MTLTSILKQYAVSSFAPPSGGFRLRTLSFNTAVYWERKYYTLGNTIFILSFPGRVTEKRHPSIDIFFYWDWKFLLKRTCQESRELLYSPTLLAVSLYSIFCSHALFYLTSDTDFTLNLGELYHASSGRDTSL